MYDALFTACEIAFVLFGLGTLGVAIWAYTTGQA